MSETINKEKENTGKFVYEENKELKPKGKIASYIYLALAIIYTISPIDAIPDTFPIIGWIDDITFLLAALLNVAQKTVAQGNELMITITKVAKFIILGIGIIIVLLVLILGAAIISIFS